MSLDKKPAGGFRPFDPVVDTETYVSPVSDSYPPSFRPFDPVVDTETRAPHRKKPQCAVFDPSIQSWILKPGFRGSALPVRRGFRPFDPVVDTETQVYKE